MSRCFSALFVFASLTLALFAQASPSPKPDTSAEPVVFDRMDNLVRFEDDGTGVRETTAVIRVQSQAGVQELGQLIFGYSSATENLETIYVRVRKPDGRVIDSPTAGAQDLAPEVFQQAPAYSDYRQRHVAVASLQPGDVLEYRIVVHVNTPVAPHEFWYEHSFSNGLPSTKNALTLISRRPVRSS